jgi:hypothetical protein
MSELSIDKLCKDLSKQRNSPLLSLILDEPISPIHIIKINRLIKEKKYEKLDVVLHSSGGNINSTYRIIELLRFHSKELTTIIPIYAKSAATLFILGSEKVIMGELAETGPLDAQIIEKKEGIKMYTSALNPFKTLIELQRFAITTLDVTVKLLLARTEYSLEEATKLSIDFVSKLLTPLFSQIKVEKMGENSRALEIGREYGKRLLKRYSMFQSEDKIETILRRLIYDYPSHGYVIDYREMQDIGFNVEFPEENTKKIIEDIIENVISKSFKTQIFLIEQD